MENNNLPLGEYEHYKGGRYRVLGVGKHSENHEDLVIYESLDENPVSKIWVRPLEMFVEDVEVDGAKTPRFRYIGQ